MKTQLKLFLLSSITTILLISSCKESINQSETISPDLNSRDTIIDNPIFFVFGLDKSVKKYYYTVSEMNLTTNKPSYYPADSLKSTIDFPDSLYENGIFIYGTMEENSNIVADTMLIEQEWRGRNLSLLLNFPNSTGSHDGGYDMKYFADSNTIYTLYRDFDGEEKRALRFKIPFITGDEYVAFMDTITVVGEVVIKTKAGIFNAMKIKKERMLNPNYRKVENIYFVENIGICFHELIYTENRKDTSDGSNYIIEQYHRYELESYNNN